MRTLHYLGGVKAESVRSFWRRNFLLDEEKPSLAGYVDMLKGTNLMNEDRRRLHEECLAAYDEYVSHSDQ